MALKRTVAPTEVPVTLAEIKAHLRVTSATEDADILFYLNAAIDQLDGPDGTLNRCLCTQTLQYTMHCFPGVVYDHAGFPVYSSLTAQPAFDLPLSPMQSVSSITYIDTAGDTQTLSSSTYRVLNANNPAKRGRIELDYDSAWPATRYIEQAVTVTYVAGYGTRNDVPWRIRALIRFVTKGMYDDRAPVVPASLEESPAFRGLRAQCTFPALD